jgi:hypothetical protein
VLNEGTPSISASTMTAHQCSDAEIGPWQYAVFDYQNKPAAHSSRSDERMNAADGVYDCGL